MGDNLERQLAEIEVLEAIYPGQCKPVGLVDSSCNGSF
jgi:hypothetical protein